MGVGVRSAHLAAGAALVAILCLQAFAPFVEIPEHMTGHAVVMQEDLLSEEVAAAMLARAKRTREFPKNSNDTHFYEIQHEHIGEAQPVNPTTGRCDHPLLVHTKDKTQCIFANRIDIGKHWIMYGGVDSLKATYESMISRVLSFGVYQWAFDDEIKGLFNEPKFQKCARAVCPADKVSDPPWRATPLCERLGERRLGFELLRRVTHSLRSALTRTFSRAFCIQQHLDPFQWNYIIQVTD